MSLYKILNKKFQKDKNRFFYPLKDNSLRNKDLIEGIKVILSKNLTMMKKTLDFEKDFTNKLNSKHSIMVNSGSSANLLALQCLINPERKKRLLYGDEVLVPAICWPTSLWPIIQSGLKPVFVDVDSFTFNISLNDLISKLSKKTKALMLVHVLGNSTNMDELMKIVNKYNLILIEDTCESLGSKYKNKYLGTFGDFSTFSFYYSHQISSIEGGMICCKNKDDSDIIKTLRSHGWSKDHSKRTKFEKKYKDINKSFVFINSGFNLRPTDVQAAIGHSQFNSLQMFISQRNKNRERIINSLIKDKRWDNQVIFLKETKNVKASWFGIAMLMSQEFKRNKNKILYKLSKLGIENRPIISGNFTKQPAIKKYNLNPKGKKYRNAQIIHDLGFFIGLKYKEIKFNELRKFNDIFFKAFNE